MFENLTSRLQQVFAKLKSRGKLNEKQVKEAMREVKLALLEADVNFKVVKDFISKVSDAAVGSEVLNSLTPAQQVIKIVNEELTSLMGGSVSKLTFSSKPPTVVMLVGLQGSGKTTATAKLAYYLRNLGKKPMMIAADTYRPAAIDQLRTLGKEIDVPVFSPSLSTPIAIAKEGVEEAKLKECDVALVDTSGRLHIDQEMMDELSKIRAEIHPHEILLVVDGMMGQDAVNIASSFKTEVDFDGVIMTKLDGDARGGAALSIKAVTGKPIKLVSLGEKTDSMEPFYPDRMSQRILGMGDVLTLIEKAEAQVDVSQARALEEKIRKQQFSLEDFLTQVKQVKKMGSLGDIMKMIPGADRMPKGVKLQFDDKKITRIEAIIQSMTLEERQNPSIISGSRRLRIAEGSGTTTQEVNQLLKQFYQTKKLLSKLSSGKMPIALGKKMFPFM